MKYTIEKQPPKIGFGDHHALLKITTETEKKKQVEKRSVMIRGTKEACEDYLKLLQEA